MRDREPDVTAGGVRYGNTVEMLATGCLAHRMIARLPRLRRKAALHSIVNSDRSPGVYMKMIVDGVAVARGVEDVKFRKIAMGPA